MRSIFTCSKLMKEEFSDSGQNLLFQSKFETINSISINYPQDLLKHWQEIIDDPQVVNCPILIITSIHTLICFERFLEMSNQTQKSKSSKIIIKKTIFCVGDKVKDKLDEIIRGIEPDVEINIKMFSSSAAIFQHFILNSHLSGVYFGSNLVKVAKGLESRLKLKQIYSTELNKQAIAEWIDKYLFEEQFFYESQPFFHNILLFFSPSNFNAFLSIFDPRENDACVSPKAMNLINSCKFSFSAIGQTTWNYMNSYFLRKSQHVVVCCAKSQEIIELCCMVCHILSEKL
ncbi:MAG: hypothetical protein MHMPM18_003711, partial [Marteilia pararefringens]